MQPLNWLWTIGYGLFWFYIYIRGRFSLFFMNFLTVFMISLFLAAPSLWVWRAWNLMGTSVRNRQKFFISYENKYYFIQLKLKYSCYSNLFGNVFQTSGVIDLIALRYAKLRCWKCISVLFWHLIQNQVFIISALFPRFTGI